jgi:hypothetical protein
VNSVADRWGPVNVDQVNGQRSELTGPGLGPGWAGSGPDLGRVGPARPGHVSHHGYATLRVWALPGLWLS